jgi:sec-independent protein translocase protein TatA
MTFGMLEGPDLIVVLIVIALFFGGAKLPQLARSIGQAKHEFERGLREPAAPESPPDSASKEPPPAPRP